MKLKDIQRVLAEIQFIRERSFPAGIDIENYIVITESLDKQIPKKTQCANKDEGWFECGSCGGCVCSSSDNLEDHAYCLLCGQKIDWS